MTLDEICNGVEKKIKVKRKVLAPGVSFSTCPDCNGSGQVTRVTNTILGRMQTSSTCSRCSGTGQIVDKKPSGADKNGMISKEETVELKKGLILTHVTPSGIINSAWL